MLINVDSRDIYNVTKDSYFKEIVFSEFRILKKCFTVSIKILTSTTIFNIDDDQMFVLIVFFVINFEQKRLLSKHIDV